MKRVRLLLLAAVAAAALAAVGNAAAAGGYPFAVGAGSGLQVFPMFPDAFPFQFTLSAHDGPTGPTGYFTIHDPDLGTFAADVQCLQIVGNRAFVAGPLKQPVEESGTTFLYATLTVEDNGEPGGAVPDRAAPLLLFPPTFERLCAAASPFSLFTFPLDQGNVVVDDGSAQ